MLSSSVDDSTNQIITKTYLSLMDISYEMSCRHKGASKQANKQLVREDRAGNNRDHLPPVTTHTPIPSFSCYVVPGRRTRYSQSHSSSPAVLLFSLAFFVFFRPFIFSISANSSHIHYPFLMEYYFDIASRFKTLIVP